MNKLNLGSGFRPLTGFINIDSRYEVHPDRICDITQGLHYPNNSVDEVRAFDFLEHIPLGKTVFVIEEIWRVLCPGGIFVSFTPSTDGRGAFQDPTHLSFWNSNSWIYYMDDAHRNLYGIKAKFKGQIEDKVTSAELKIVHTLARLEAVK